MPEINTVTIANEIEQYQPVPVWLTKDYLEKTLRNYFKDDSLEIIDLDLTPATAKGDNYASIMTRIHVKYISNNNPEGVSESYIAKTSFEGNEFAYEALKNYDIYNREIEIYEKILPKLNLLLHEIGEKEKIFANTIATDYEHCAIIFEDLSVYGYKLAERSRGLDMEAIQMCLKKLAKMHATSAVLNERCPYISGILKNYDRGFFTRHTDTFSNYYIGNLDACARLVSQWPDYKHFAQKLSKLKSNIMEKGRQSFDIDDNDFNALTHGDFWKNNVMFTFDEDMKPTEVVLFDFQYSCWGSPSIDLWYFLQTSLNEEIRLNCLEELIQYYYNILTDTLRALNYTRTIPTLTEFRLQIYKREFYAFVCACLVQPVMLNEDLTEADFNSIVGNDERAKRYKNTVYQNKTTQRNLRKLLPIFDRRGLLD